MPSEAGVKENRGGWNTRAHGVWLDVRLAGRTLWKSRGFAAVAMVTLALGIGASTAIFSVIDNVLLEPFPYRDAKRYVALEIHDTDQAGPGYRGAFKGPELLDYMEQNHAFDRVIANNDLDVLYTSGPGTERYHGILVTSGTFEFFGMEPLLGRALEPADYQPGAPPTFVMRYKVWKAHFSGDPGIVGRTFVLNGTARTLVGIMPPRFAWGDGDVWIPSKPPRAPQAAGALAEYWYMMGHLKPGLTMQQAESDFAVLAQNLAKIYPDDYPKHFQVKLETLADQVVGQFRSTLFIVMAAVGLLLLIGCGNVANLLLARATSRQKEFGIRAALGASRWRLARQLLVESLALALGGAALGTLLTWSLLKGLVAVTPPSIIPSEALIRMNGAVLLFTLGVAAATALIFGLAPALQATRRDLNDSLRDGGKGSSGSGGGRGSNRLRNAVVVGEVALSLTLLIAAGLLMRSFIALHQVHLGLRPDHVLVARLPLPPDRYKTSAQMTAFFRPLLARLKALPGVVEATETSTLPPYGGIDSEIEIPGKTHTETWTGLFQLCSEGYFKVLRIDFLQGRPFSEAEVNGARKLAVINETFERKYFGAENPIGQRVRLKALEKFADPVPDAWFEVIGVVADVKNQGLQDKISPEVWVPYNVTGSAMRGVLLRTAGDPQSLMKTMQQEIWDTDRGVALAENGTLENFINSFSYAQPRFGFLLITVFATLGLLLVSIGVYSVIAYTTARRTHEIGIRMALGAARSDVQKLVIRTGLKLVVAGIVIGLLASLAISRVLTSELTGVSPRDPLTLTLVPLLLLAIGLVACWIPARRATRVSPVVALRYE